MKRIKLFSILVFIMCTPVLLAQNPLDFFPHHEGDIWEYWYQEDPPGYTIRQNRILSDSLGSDGRYYVETSRFGVFIVDTTTFEVYRAYLGPVGVFYKLNADSGDAWTVRQDSSGDRISARVLDVYDAVLFNQPVVVKVIDYYLYFGHSDSLWVETQYLASNFGIIRNDIEFSAPYHFIRGAIIDSVRYGHVTGIQIKEEPIPQDFTLYQNYPNPFNPQTNIRFTLPKENQVTLNIYNIQGQLIKRLVKQRYDAGAYTVNWNGRDRYDQKVASGIYIYRIQAGSFSQTRKMILIK